jgi:hypothetical protein
MKKYEFFLGFSFGEFQSILATKSGRICHLAIDT